MPTNYNEAIAAQLVTLSSIAYAGSKTPKDITQIRKQIVSELTLDDNPTKGEWALVWGPVLGVDSNVAYIAKQANTNNYAFVWRGTIGDVASWWEDVPTAQVEFPYISSTKTKVSNHFLDGLNGVLAAKDTKSGNTAGEFFNETCSNLSEGNIYVTGHSQGAGLTPMALAWLLQQSDAWPSKTAIKLSGYGFAPPTSGDPAFAHWIANNSECYQIINPLDVVPHGYAAINKVIPDNIPDKVPDELYLPIYGAEALVNSIGPWQQPETLIQLRAVQLPKNISYSNQIRAQHNPNSYLYLMTSGAAVLPNKALLTGVGNTSPLPEYD